MMPLDIFHPGECSHDRTASLIATTLLLLTLAVCSAVGQQSHPRLMADQAEIDLAKSWIRDHAGIAPLRRAQERDRPVHRAWSRVRVSDEADLRVSNVHLPETPGGAPVRRVQAVCTSLSGGHARRYSPAANTTWPGPAGTTACSRTVWCGWDFSMASMEMNGMPGPDGRS